MGVDCQKCFGKGADFSVDCQKSATPCARFLGRVAQSDKFRFCERGGGAAEIAEGTETERGECGVGIEGFGHGLTPPGVAMRRDD